MPTKTKPTSTIAPSTPVTAKPPSKSVLVLRLLGRAKGATIAELEEPTGWQPHSTRAFLSGLRKKGMTIAREPRKTGETAYRIVTATGSAADARTASVTDLKAATACSAAEVVVEVGTDGTTDAAAAAIEATA